MLIRPQHKPESMRVSVVICTYSIDLYTDFCEAVQSVLDQTYEDVEVVAVVDGNQRVFDRAKADWGDHARVMVHCNDENRGLSASRNRGIDIASGDVVAFMDDDAVADDDWIAKLMATYDEHGAEAVGGKMTPLWVAGKPAFLPAEFYWLVGVTHRGFSTAGPVRNTFGSNISFRADVLDTLGGFDEQLGRKGDKHVQGEETELAARLRSEMDGTLYYTPEAKVGHKVFEYRTSFPWLVKRAFWQGYSKRVMEQLVPDSSENETRFLKRLLVEFIPGRIGGLFRSPSWPNAQQLVSIFVFTFCVGLGYLYGIVNDLFS